MAAIMWMPVGHMCDTDMLAALHVQHMASHMCENVRRTATLHVHHMASRICENVRRTSSGTHP